MLSSSADGEYTHSRTAGPSKLFVIICLEHFYGVRLALWEAYFVQEKMLPLIILDAHTTKQQEIYHFYICIKMVMVYKQMLSQKNKHFKSYTDDSGSKQTWEYFCKLKQNTRLPQYVEHYL